MGRKKRTQVFVLKPWCWYCEREFEDDKVLLQHQKSKHFKCQLCPRKLNTAGGLMVHSQQVHKCEPEPLTNTLPGRDSFDVEIFGMEGVPNNALAEWKARKETEAGSVALAAAAAGKRPRHAYTVIPEADLQAALAQHRLLMAKRENPVALPNFPPPSFYPPGMPPSLQPGYPMSMPPQSMPPMPGFMPPFPPNAVHPANPSSPAPPRSAADAGMSQSPVRVSQQALQEDPDVVVLPPKDGVIWPDPGFIPAEKRALHRRYRYQSPSDDGDAVNARKRKAAEDFL